MMDLKGVLSFLVSLAFPFLLSMELQPCHKLDWNHNQFVLDVFTIFFLAGCQLFYSITVLTYDIFM